MTGLPALEGDSPRLAPHLHAPLQSGSNAVLKRMGRHWYNAESYEEAVSSIDQQRDTVRAVRDVIAGFPGETQDDHAQTMAMVERLPLHVASRFPVFAASGNGRFAAERCGVRDSRSG